MFATKNFFRFASATLVLYLAASFAAPARADVYDDAVNHPGRSAADLKRDPNEKPAEMMRFAGIKPGMSVVDVLAASGYYSELLSYVVGPKGHVLLLNNPAYDAFSNNGWRERIEQHHLANVEHRTVDMADMKLGSGTFDAAVLNKVYHDLYWVSPSDGWPKIDAGAVLDQLARALKAGGVVLVVDHSAKAGTGSSAAQDLHRIDETYMRKDFESHGFEFVAKSDAFRRPDDKRDEITYKGPMVGKTDRFVYLFRKPLK
jgi:predicted methyltransferase